MYHCGWKMNGVNDIRERQTERGGKGERRACKQGKGDGKRREREKDKARLLEAEEEAKFK